MVSEWVLLWPSVLEGGSNMGQYLHFMLLLLPLLNLASLDNRVEDVLERLLEADLAFWVDSKGFNLSRPEAVLTLYQDRVVRPVMENVLVRSKQEISPKEMMTKEKQENEMTATSQTPPIHYLRQLAKQNLTVATLLAPASDNHPMHYLRQLAKRDLPAIYQRDQVLEGIKEPSGSHNCFPGAVLHQRILHLHHLWFQGCRLCGLRCWCPHFGAECQQQHQQQQ